MKTLADLGADRNTFTLFTSDNGPVEPGSTGGLRGGKGTLWEGGIRMPGIIRWPERCTSPSFTLPRLSIYTVITFRSG